MIHASAYKLLLLSLKAWLRIMFSTFQTSVNTCFQRLGQMW